jgi:hypothetical protein
MSIGCMDTIYHEARLVVAAPADIELNAEERCELEVQVYRYVPEYDLDAL